MRSIKTSIAAGAAVMILGLPACSNVEDGYHVADRSNLKLSIRPQSTQASGGSGSLQNLSIINAVNGTDKVYVDCPANWKVEVTGDEKPEEHTEWTLYIDETGSDSGGRFFTFSSSINIRDQREWANAIKVYVEGLDGEELVPQYLTVRQTNNVLVPTPTSFSIFPAAGGAASISVESTDNDWSVESSVEAMSAYPEGWISIDRTHQGEGVLNFTVLPNRGTSVRSGSLRFLDGSGKLVADINISQSGSTNTFDVYSSGEGNLLSQAGAEFTVNVLSDKGWKVECPQAGSNGWLTVEGLGQNQPASVGTEGGAGRQLSVKVAPNPGQSNREALLAFIRTEDNATENQGGVASIYIKVIQAGTQQPALTEPWLEGIYTQQAVDMYARYYSDVPVEALGIEVRNLTDGTDFVAVPGTGLDGVIHVQLLKNQDYGGVRYFAGNEYEIRSYIVTGFGRLVSPAVWFKAPGVKPTNDDQTDPGVK